MTSLTGADFAVIGGLIAAFLAVPVTLMVFSLKSQAKRLDGVERRVLDLEGSRVSHRDWVRVVVSLTNRQNRMSEQLAEVAAKLDASLGIGAQIRRISDTLESQVKP